VEYGNSQMNMNKWEFMTRNEMTKNSPMKMKMKMNWKITYENKKEIHNRKRNDNSKLRLKWQDEI